MTLRNALYSLLVLSLCMSCGGKSLKELQESQGEEGSGDCRKGHNPVPLVSDKGTEKSVAYMEFGTYTLLDFKAFVEIKGVPLTNSNADGTAQVYFASVNGSEAAPLCTRNMRPAVAVTEAFTAPIGYLYQNVTGAPNLMKYARGSYDFIVSAVGVPSIAKPMESTNPVYGVTKDFVSDSVRSEFLKDGVADFKVYKLDTTHYEVRMHGTVYESNKIVDFYLAQRFNFTKQP